MKKSVFLYKLLKNETKTMTPSELIKFEQNLRSTIPPAIQAAAELARHELTQKKAGKDEQ